MKTRRRKEPRVFLALSCLLVTLILANKFPHFKKDEGIRILKGRSTCYV